MIAELQIASYVVGGLSSFWGAAKFADATCGLISRRRHSHEYDVDTRWVGPLGDSHTQVNQLAKARATFMKSERPLDRATAEYELELDYIFGRKQRATPVAKQGDAHVTMGSAMVAPVLIPTYSSAAVFGGPVSGAGIHSDPNWLNCLCPHCQKRRRGYFNQGPEITIQR